MRHPILLSVLQISEIRALAKEVDGKLQSQVAAELAVYGECEWFYGIAHDARDVRGLLLVLRHLDRSGEQVLAGQVAMEHKSRHVLHPGRNVGLCLKQVYLWNELFDELFRGHAIPRGKSVLVASLIAPLGRSVIQMLT